MTEANNSLGDLAILLVGEELRQATGGSTFANTDPATEVLLGEAADGTAQDMDDAIGAARRAFDETDWSTSHGFRAHCLRQLADAFDSHATEMRALTTAEVGAPEFLLDGPQYQAPVDGLRVSADLAENYDRWTEDLGESEFMGSMSHRWALREAAGVVGAITP